MTHEMNLNPEPFEMIKSGAKSIELRLYDEKRRKIRVGDRIIFTCTQPPFETISVSVTALYLYDSFSELYKDLDLLKCGYTESEIAAASPEDMNVYYSEEQQRKHGVVGIEIKFLNK